MCVLTGGPASHSRMEIVKVMQQKSIQAMLTAYSFVAVVPLVLFLILVPGVMMGNTESLSSFFVILSLVQRLRTVGMIFLLRCFVTVFDARTSLNRIQVPRLFTSPPSLPLPLPLSLSLSLPPPPSLIFHCGESRLVHMCLHFLFFFIVSSLSYFLGFRKIFIGDPISPLLAMLIDYCCALSS